MHSPQRTWLIQGEEEYLKYPNRCEGQAEKKRGKLMRNVTAGGGGGGGGGGEGGGGGGKGGGGEGTVKLEKKSTNPQMGC